MVKDKPLSDWPAESMAVVSRVKTHDPEKLRYLKSIRLVPGSPFKVVTCSPFNGPVHLECAGTTFVIGTELARELYVQALENQESAAQIPTQNP